MGVFVGADVDVETLADTFYIVSTKASHEAVVACALILRNESVQSSKRKVQPT